MKIRLVALACTLATVGATACTPADDAGMEEGDAGEMAEAAATGAASEQMLADWNVRLDERRGDLSAFWMAAEDDGFSVETGAAGIAWRSTDVVDEGDFTASASFTELQAPAGHREAYGIVVGGRQLEGADQQYSYFLVRGDGSYLIKRRTGESTSTLVDWTPSEAVRGIQGAGEDNPNELAVRVTGDQVEFVANGTVVETLPASDVEPWGVAGIRVNHNLDVRIDDWSVEGASGGMGGG